MEKPSRRAGRRVWLFILILLIGITGPSASAADSSRFSDEPSPLRLDDFPERPRPLLELGDPFLGTGNLQRGFRLPGGAVWSPSLWVFGSYRSAIQTFEPGSGPRRTEWANRLDLFANLQLSPTERVVVGFRPIDRFVNGSSRFTGYNIEPARPSDSHGWQDEYRATPTTFFFEGEFGEMFPLLDQADRLSLDYGFSVGRQPLLLQDGILVNDDSIDIVSITRNALFPAHGSHLKVSAIFGWDEIERADNTEDRDAYLIGIDSFLDLPKTTLQGNLLYVPADDHGDGFYAGLGAIQRLGKLNTTFRVNTSVAVEEESARVRNGTLLFAELSFDWPRTHNLVYLNGFWGIDDFSSAVRSPTAGGPLGRVGILNAAVGLGRYGAPLSNFADDSVGANLGYQMFFGELRRTQLILEVGARAPTKTPSLTRQQEAAGVGARFQQALGRRFVLVADAFGVAREESKESYGGRLELLVRF